MAGRAMAAIGWRLLVVVGLLWMALPSPAAAQAPAGLATPAGRAAAAPPSITATAAILVDVTNETVLYGREMHERRAIASLTKVMTAVVALRYGNLADEVTIEARDLPGEASIELRPGDRLSLETLLYGMMMRSGNDAAAAVARRVGEKVAAERAPGRDGMSLFLDLMNQQAASLGMTNTHFVNPHGLDATGQFSTAYDLALLTRHAIQNPAFVRLFEARSYPFRNRVWTNVNRLLYQYEGIIGGKTGIETRSGLCLIELAERGGRRVLAIVLNAPRWYDDATALLDYGFGEGRQQSSESLAPFGAASPATGLPVTAMTASVQPTVAPEPVPSAPAAPVAAMPAVAATPEAMTAATNVPAPAGEAAGGQPLASVAAPAADSGLWSGPLFLAVVIVLGALLVMGLMLQLTGAAPWQRRRVFYHDDQSDWSDPSTQKAGDRLYPSEAAGWAPAADAEPAEAEAPVDESPAAATRSGQTDELAAAHIAVALRYVSQERFEAAQDAFVKAIQRAPRYRFSQLSAFWEMAPEGYLALAQAYTACNRPIDARAVAAIGLIEFPGEPILLELDERLQAERRRAAGRPRPAAEPSEGGRQSAGRRP
jgi:D-alanyl-D-alanine carboxypeptidase